MPRRPKCLKPLLLVASFAALAACDAPWAGEITGPALDVPDCEQLGEVQRFEPFRLTFRHATVHHHDSAATIRLSASGAYPKRIDQLVFTVPDAVTHAAHLDTATSPLVLQLDPSPESAPGQARMNLILMARCDVFSAVMVGRGTIELDAFGPSGGDRIAGRIRVDFVDPRTHGVLGAGFVGEFDLDVETGGPLVAFAPENHQ